MPVPAGAAADAGHGADRRPLQPAGHHGDLPRGGAAVCAGVSGLRQRRGPRSLADLRHSDCPGHGAGFLGPCRAIAGAESGAAGGIVQCHHDQRFCLAVRLDHGTGRGWIALWGCAGRGLWNGCCVAHMCGSCRLDDPKARAARVASGHEPGHDAGRVSLYLCQQGGAGGDLSRYVRRSDGRGGGAAAGLCQGHSARRTARARAAAGSPRNRCDHHGAGAHPLSDPRSRWKAAVPVRGAVWCVHPAVRALDHGVDLDTGAGPGGSIRHGERDHP